MLVQDFYEWVEKLHKYNGRKYCQWRPQGTNIIIGVHVGAIKFLKPVKGDMVDQMDVQGLVVRIPTKEGITYSSLGHTWVVTNNWSVPTARLYREETDESVSIAKKFQKYIQM
eukprot:5876963-Lingulodinium_polyedra.AAC.1